MEQNEKAPLFFRLSQIVNPPFALDRPFLRERNAPRLRYRAIRELFAAHHESRRVNVFTGQPGLFMVGTGAKRRIVIRANCVLALTVLAWHKPHLALWRQLL